MVAGQRQKEVTELLLLGHLCRQVMLRGFAAEDLRSQGLAVDLHLQRGYQSLSDFGIGSQLVSLC